MNPMIPDKKKYVLGVVSDLAIDFLIYDRKEDEDLSRDDLGSMLSSGEITVEEISERFSESLKKLVNR